MRAYHMLMLYVLTNIVTLNTLDCLMFRRGNRCLERFIVGPKNRNPVDISLLSSSVFLTQKMFNIQGIPAVMQ